MERDHFLIYLIAADEDKYWRASLEKHLALFVKKQGIHLWHAQMISPGHEVRQVHEKKLRQASLVLLLTSADCFNECEADIAFLEQHCSSTTVIPVLVRKFNLQYTPFFGCQSLPRDGVPLTQCADLDEALQEVVRSISEVVLSQFASNLGRDQQKEKWLKAMLADHTTFLNDRLQSFVGREQELAEVRALITEQQQSGGYITITGQAGQGKSSVLAKLVEHYGREVVPSHFIPFRPGPDYQVSLLRDLMARLILKHDLSDIYVATTSRPALRDYFLNLLRELAAKGQQEIIFLDGLDQIEEDLTGGRDLSFLPDQPPAGIVFVLGTRPDDTLRPLKLLTPHVEYPLPPLSKEDFERILARREVHLNPTVIEQLHQALQENALYLDLVARELSETGALAPRQIIERVASDPSHLFSFSIQRLRRSALEWREVIKPVLGVLLAAQEPFLVAHLHQILPTVEEERLRDALVHLGGLLTRTAQGAYALFHLKLRDYLREDEVHPHLHVFARDEEEQYHVLLASWCERGGIGRIWEETRAPREQARRTYARRYYLTHLYEAQLDLRLFAALDEGSYGRAKERQDRTARTYIQDLDLGRRAATRPHLEPEEAIALLPVLWRYTLLRSTIRSQADHYPDSLFDAMLLLHREADVLGLAELLTERSERVKLLLRIASHFAAQPGKHVESMQAFLRAQGIAFAFEDGYERVEAMCQIGTALVQMQQIEWALKVLTQAEEEARDIERASSRYLALREIVTALALAHQWSRAEEVADQIKGEWNRAWALNTIGQALAVAQQQEQARGILVQAEGVANSIEDKSEREQILHDIVKGMALAHQWSRAEEVADQIEDASNRALALSGISDALVQAQKTEQALRVLAQAEEATRGFKGVFVVNRDYALRKIVQVLVHAQQWERAVEVAETIAEGWRDRAWCAIVYELARTQQWKRAEEVASRIERDEDKIQALSEIGRFLAQAQQEEPARKILAQAEEGARSLTSHQASGLYEMASALAQMQQWERAEEIAGMIEDGEYRVNALGKIGRELILAQQHEQALRIFTQAEEIAGSIEKVMEKVYALGHIGRELAKARQQEQTLRVLVQIEKLASSEAFVNKERALSVLASGLAWAQQWKKAEEVADTIKDAIGRRNALSTIYRVRAQVQQWEKPNESADGFRDAFSKALDLSAGGWALAKAQQYEQALNVLLQAEEIANSIENVVEKEYALRHVVGGLALARQWEKAEEVVDRIKKEHEKGWALMEFAEGLSQVQEWDRAEKIAGRIKRENFRCIALDMIVQSLAEAQQWDRAEKVVGTMTIEKERSLRKIGQELAKAHQWELFVPLLQRTWLATETHTSALDVFAIASHLFATHPSLYQDLLAAFEWVDTFLKGPA